MGQAGKPAILCLGHDAVLNRTRRLILERIFDVVVAEKLSDVAKLLADRRFALVLFCYSLTREECRTSAELVHHHSPESRILAFAEDREQLGLRPQDEIFLSGGPAELLRKASSMAGVPFE